MVFQSVFTKWHAPTHESAPGLCNAAVTAKDHFDGGNDKTLFDQIGQRRQQHQNGYLRVLVVSESSALPIKESEGLEDLSLEKLSHGVV